MTAHNTLLPWICALVAALSLNIGCADDDTDPVEEPEQDASVNPFDVPQEDTENDTGDTSLDDVSPDTPSDSTPDTIALRFERHTDSNAFDIFVDLITPSGERVTNTSRVLLSVDQDPAPGTLSTVEVDGDSFRATFTPTQTGRVTIIARAPDFSLNQTRSALILSEIHADWNQPEPVPGLVNTTGWEDGPSISSDGRYLVLQYLPVPLDCVISGDIDSPSCISVSGPTEGPERPDMPGIDRVAEDGTITHGCPSLGVPELPFPVPPNSLYVFERQEDGSFTRPQPIFLDGADGCIGSFGGHILTADFDNDPATPLQNRLIYALDGPLDNEDTQTQADIFVSQDLDFSSPSSLGRFFFLQGSTRFEHPATPILTTAPQQGNPHVLQDPSNPDRPNILFFDDETERKDIFFANLSGPVTSPNTTLSEINTFPTSINTPDEEESQPFYTGTHLIFRRDLTLFISSTSPPPNLNPSTPSILLAGDSSATTPGTILGVGEPSTGNFEGNEELYFVFVEIAPDRTLNLDVGRVSKRSAE